MEIRIEVITPQKAAYYLEKNKRNRTLSTHVVKNYAEQMRSGTFKETGDSIKFDTNGILIDGQHRLQAIIMSGVSCKFVIAENLHETAFDCLDIGKKRGAGDSLSILGCANAARVAAMLRVLYVLRTEPSGLIPITKLKGGGLVSNADVVTLFKEEPKSEELVSLIGKGHKTALSYCGSGLLGLFYDCWKKEPDVVLDFFTKISTGVNLQEHHPILYLRHYLMRDAMAPIKLPNGLKYWLFIKIWQDCRKGVQIRRAVHLPEYIYTSFLPPVK